MLNSASSGLAFTDRGAWQRWQRNQAPIHRRIRTVLSRRPDATSLRVSVWGEPNAAVDLIALDSTSPSQLPALVDPARHLLHREAAIAFIAPPPVATTLGGVIGAAPNLSFAVAPGIAPPVHIRSVLSAGDHLHAGKLARAWAQHAAVAHVVVQHGILTPYTPPLPDNTHLLAWSAHDATFWTGSGTPPGEVVGSQLLWKASQRGVASSPSNTDTVTFLGQLHGAELPRRLTRRSVSQLTRSHKVTYRPHPGETDVASRLQHRLWQRQGVEVSSAGAIGDTKETVVAHFSTGILEAAAMGHNAYAYCVDPPQWLTQLWQRYNMALWGAREPIRPDIAPVEPAVAVADYIEGVRK